MVSRHTGKPKVRTKKIGRCIYCLSNGMPHGLSREHVFPKGLGGPYILHKASCAACAKITGQVELRVLRDFSLMRRATGFPIRAPKEHAKSAPIMVRKGSGFEPKEIPVSEHPSQFILPIFMEPPGIVTGKKIGDTYSVNIRAFAAEQRLDALKNEHGLFRFESGLHLVDFYRMIAKIAHGVAVAHRGLFTFEPLLPAFILGKNLDLGPHLIGKPLHEWVMDPSDWTFCAQMGPQVIGNKIYVSIIMTLFTDISPDVPSYQVIVGEALPR